MTIPVESLSATRQYTPLIDINMTRNQSPWLRQCNHAADAGNGNLDGTPEELMMGWGLLQMYGTQALQADTAPMKTLPERLATILLDLCNEQNGRIQGVSFQMLADSLGTYRETIGAILRAFKRQGLVEASYRNIQILDVASLKELSGVMDWQ